MPNWVRKLVRLPVAIVGVCVVLWLGGWLLRPRLTPAAPSYTPGQAAAAIAARDVTFDPAHTPSLHRHELVKPAGESPLLKSLVDDSKLPKLADRMPTEPVVMAGGDGIGNYGGTWLLLSNAAEDVSVIGGRMSGAFLARWSPLGYPIEPHLAQSIEPSADKKVWTVKLRPGLKWSDGQPFNADDIMYWWRDDTMNRTLADPPIPPPWMMIGGQAGDVQKVDDYTVRFVFPKSYPLFLETLLPYPEPTNTPAHYLRQYNPDPKIGDKAVIERDMKAYKMTSARSLYTYVKGWQNPDCPRLWPWVYRSYKGDPPQVFVRNPYYYAVDTAGNQLPYIDRLQFDVQDPKLLALTAAGGGATMQGRHIRFSDYTELVSRGENSGTRVLNWYPAIRSNWVINPNLNRRIDPDDPTTQLKAELLSDKHFRQALSLAIDRRKIIQAEQCGIGTPVAGRAGAALALSQRKAGKGVHRLRPGPGQPNAR